LAQQACGDRSKKENWGQVFQMEMGVFCGGANKNKFNTYKISRDRGADADFWAYEASSMPTLV
jgi:hypothetical protein